MVMNLVPQHALAADVNLTPDEVKNGTLSWVNAATIKMVTNGKTVVFKDGDIGDPNDTFSAVDYMCPDSTIKVSNKNLSNNSATIKMKITPPSSVVESCIDGGEYKNKTLEAPENSQIKWQMIGNNIQRVDGKGTDKYSFDRISGNIFGRKGDSDGCKDVIVIDAAAGTGKMYWLVSGSGGPALPPELNVTGCKAVVPDGDDWGWLLNTDTTGQSTFAIAGVAADGTDDPTDPNVTPVSNTDDPATSSAIVCYTTLKDPLTYVICPIINSAQRAVQNFYAAITNELDIDVNAYFDESGSNQVGSSLYEAWSSIRYIGLSILVVVALVMVISQAMSLDIFDAYTIRKVLPRLILAVILITLSWELCKFGIQLANDVGRGIRALVEFPFRDIPAPNVGGAANTLVVAGSIGTVALASTFGIIGTVMFLVTALIAVVVAFATLIFRKMLIVLLVVTAPFAIACLVLPNTQRVWKMWWENFFKALMLFPLIALFIAGSAVFAKIAGLTSQGDNDLLTQLIIFAAVFGPFFALPMAFKLAGGALAGVAGLASRGGGIVGSPASSIRNNRQKKQQEKWASRGAKARAGELFGGKSYLPGTEAAADRMNAMTRGFGQGAGSLYGLGVTGRQRARADAEKHAVIENAANDIMKSGIWAPVANNEEALRAGTYKTENEARTQLAARYRASGMGAEEVARTVDNAVAGFKATGHKFGDEAFQFAAAKQLVETGTGYTGMADMASTLARASNGNKGTASALAGFSNSRSKDKGRSDLAPGFGSLNGLVQDTMDRPNMMMDGGKLFDAQLKASRGMDAVSVLRGKPDNLKNHANILHTGLRNSVDRMNNASLSAGERRQALDEAKQLVGQIRQLDGNKSYASVQNQQIVNGLVGDTSAVQEQLVASLRAMPDADAQMADLSRLSAPPRYVDPDNPNAAGGPGGPGEPI